MHEYKEVPSLSWEVIEKDEGWYYVHPNSPTPFVMIPGDAPEDGTIQYPDIPVESTILLFSSLKRSVVYFGLYGEKPVVRVFLPKLQFEIPWEDYEIQFGLYVIGERGGFFKGQESSEPLKTLVSPKAKDIPDELLDLILLQELP